MSSASQGHLTPEIPIGSSTSERAATAKRILLVDDTPENLRLLIRMLPPPLYSAHPASSGELALKFVQTTLPDLILLDVMMPGMDGYEVCRRLKEDPRTRDIPVIFLSAADQISDKAKAFAGGGVDYITKPFDPAEVLMRIQAHLSLREEQKRLERHVAERTARLAELDLQLQQQTAERLRVQQRLASLESMMVDMTLIESKILPPQAPRPLLLLPRLERQFTTACGHRLVTITAPAGYGKSTLLQKLCAHAEAAGMASCWLSLDDEDNTPLEFLRYVAATLQGAWADPEFCALTAHTPGNAQALQGALCNALRRLHKDTVLLLDDYQTIENQEVHDQLERLIAHSPPHLKFFIASRSALPLKLSRLRVDGAVYEFGTADLSLQLDEVGPFISGLTGQTLEPAQVERLYRNTEGWPAGLQLASLAIGSIGSIGTIGNVTEFLDDFSGRDKDIAAYISEIIVNRMPPRLAQFLGFTALFERFSLALCHIAFAPRETLELLAAARERNLFLLPLDREEHWFRYHHLFADYLRSRYLALEPQEARAMYGKASAWFERHDLMREAIRYALAGDDPIRAADLVADSAYTLVRQHGEYHTLLGWIDRLPPSYIELRPGIRLAQVWALICLRRYGEADRLLSGLESAIDSGVAADTTPTLVTVPDLARRAGMMRCVLNSLTGDPESGIASCLNWLARWGQCDPGELGTVRAMIGYAALQSQDYPLARSSLAAARKGLLKTDCDFGCAWADILLAMVAMEEARPDEAAAILTQAIEGMARNWGASAVSIKALSIVLAEVCYEQNRLDQAEQLLDGLDLNKVSGPFHLLLSGYRTRARLLWLRGAHEQADACLAEGIAATDDGGGEATAFALEAERAVLRLRNGQARPALPAMAQVPAGATDGPERLLLEVRLQVAGGRHEQAQQTLVRLLAEARRQGRRLRVMQLLGLRAAVQSARGNRDEALRSLSEAIEISSAGGACRVLADAGGVVTELLRQIALRAPHGHSYDGHLACVMEAVASKSHSTPPRQPQAAPPPSDAGELSDRELQILRLVARGLGNRDLAAQLFLSEATVKWHLRNIYLKLNVGSRSSAIARAHELSLV